ncbi:C39 family peptidase [Bacillus sp. REN10]|uniref:C39 family peptidase n=1 Tax=Bacillus sp. REN10 TaxID=2782541 RepID=UPI00193C74B3|nr:C39 family peptidase [Bacillus sp. REN10]
MHTGVIHPSQIKQVPQLIEAIRQLWDLRSYRALKNWLAQMETEEEYYRLIRLADAGAMYQYSGFLAALANKRFRSVRTLAWYGYNLLEQGKSMEAETKMKQRLFEEEVESLTVSERTSAYLLLVRALCQLHRYQEAEQYMKRIQAEGGTLSPDQLAGFYLDKNDWARAEQEVQKGLDLPFEQRGDICWLIYADLLSKQGRQEEALAALQKGAELFPEYPVFQMAQYRYFRILGNYPAIVKAFDSLVEENPFHANAAYFIYVKAEALYKLEKWEELQHWIDSHQSVFKKTVFAEKTIQPNAAHKELTIQPIEQKLNYCVPATLSMLLQTAGSEKTQDEIAEHVFEATGSKLRKAMDYMASLGFSSKFFKGTVELYKPLIDAGYPIMLDMMIENTSHVQLVIGYDDRLGVLLVQDPNELETMLVSYEEAAKDYRLKDQLSLAFVRHEQQELLMQLNETDHQFFQQMYEHLDQLDEGGESAVDELLVYLTNHEHEIFSSVIGLTMIQDPKAKPFLEKWVEHMKERLGEEDEEVQLLIAHAYYMHHLTDEKFQQAMSHVKQKRAYGHFLQGIVDYQKDRTEQAIFHLKRSLEKDSFQPNAYAYLARCYADFSQFSLAQQWAEVALELDETDEFIRLTYALVLFESGGVQGALKQFEQLAKDYPNDDYYVYEIGRCYMEMEDKQAVKWFKKAIDMNPEIAYPYLRMAEMLMAEEKWEQAEMSLRTGAEKFVPEEETGILWLYIGHTRMSRELYELAEEAYHRAAQLDEDGDLLALVYEAQAIIQQGDWERAQRTIQQRVTPLEYPEMYVRAGGMMLEEGKSEAEQLIGLDFMEAGLIAGDDWRKHISLYIEYVEESPFIHRALAFLQKLRAKHPVSELYCFEAILHEQLDNPLLAERLLLEAVDLDPSSTFPHYRLGKLYLALEQYEEAETHLQACLVIDNEFIAAYEELVDLYEELEQIDKAKKYLFYLFEQMPQACDMKRLIEWMSTEKEKETLFTHLKQLEGKVDEDWRLHALSDVLPLEEAIRLLEKEESLALKAQLATLYIRNGQEKQAFALLQELIQEEPENEELYEPWIAVLSKLKKLLKLEKIIKKMNLSSEEMALVYRNSADALIPFVHEEMEKEQHGIFRKLTGGMKFVSLFGAVVAYYKQAIKVEPDDPEGYSQLATFYTEHDLADDAYKVLKSYLGRQDDDSFRFRAAASALSYAYETGKQNYAKAAQEQLFLLKERRSTDPAVREMLADTFLLLDQPEQAIVEYQALVRMAPYHIAGYIGLLMIYLDLDQVQEAKKYVKAIPDSVRQGVLEQLAEMVEEQPLIEELLK